MKDEVSLSPGANVYTEQSLLEILVDMWLRENTVKLRVAAVAPVSPVEIVTRGCH